MQMSISLNNSTVLVLVNGKKFELTRTRNSNSTWLETRRAVSHIFSSRSYLQQSTIVIDCWPHLPRPLTLFILHLPTWTCWGQIFAVRRYASTILAMFICLSICLTQVGIVSKLLNVKNMETTPHDSTGTLVCDAKDLGEIWTGSP